MIVADASPLIVLAKLKRLGLLNGLYEEMLIGPVIKSETIDSGKAIHAPGVEQLEAALEAGGDHIEGLVGTEVVKLLLKRGRGLDDLVDRLLEGVGNAERFLRQPLLLADNVLHVLRQQGHVSLGLPYLFRVWLNRS